MAGKKGVSWNPSYRDPNKGPKWQRDQRKRFHNRGMSYWGSGEYSNTYEWDGATRSDWPGLVELASGYGLYWLEDRVDFYGVNARTIMRWDESGEAPLWAFRMTLFRCQNIGSILPEWKGWHIRGEALYTPDGSPVSESFIKQCLAGGTLVQRAELRESRARAAQQLAEERLAYIVHCLAGFIAAYNAPTINRNFEVEQKVSVPVTLMPEGR